MPGVSEKAERISSCRVSTSSSQKLTEGRLLLQEETRGERMKLLSEEVMAGFVPANGGQQLQWEQAVPRDPWTPLPCRDTWPRHQELKIHRSQQMPGKEWVSHGTAKKVEGMQGGTVALGLLCKLTATPVRELGWEMDKAGGKCAND